MSTSHNKTPKYRPYLTADNIRHILSLCKADSPLSHQSRELIKILAPYMAKIENDALTPAHTLSPKPSLLESLGSSDTSSQDTTGSDMTLSPEQQREAAYHKWNIQGKDACTLRELELAYEYRVHHDLLTDSELAQEEESWNVDMSQYTTIGENK